ncbi:uncharacterized protein LOC126567949 [Anopheles maculipalpis]|uniref:uncharacterized protein LOC126567949 n=1 Tax=Anopheles maculipalpis TaxID=1496333 RepID=UPI0021590E05|nr:uncharacterized protein LOC126567949 [Anopheles maculipalpis]
MSDEINSKPRKSVIIQHHKRRTSWRSDDAFNRKYKAAVKAYHNYMEGLNLILKEKEAKMCKILHKRSTPLWFQELTDEQCAICDQFLDAIADDTEERTFYRTESLLRKLGVYPVCSKRILRTALILCSWNDISFLWILLELHYIRRPGQDGTRRVKDYTINERLLLSAIAHLDMMTTLRGLEKILPPRKANGSSPMEEKHTQMTKLESSSSCSKSPYARRQKVIVTGYTVPVQVQPHRDEFLGRYEKYRDPEYVIRNEESRWFARYGGSRKNLSSSDYYISGEISRGSSASSVSSKNSASAVVMHLLNDQIRNMVARQECCEMLCPKHHKLDEQGAQLLGILKRNTAARDVLMQAVRAQCVQWADEELQDDAKRQVESLLKRLVDEAVTMAILEPTNECPECRERFEIQQKLLKGQKCTCVESEGSDTLVPEIIANMRYFKFCDKPVPFEFDHEKIFQEYEEKEPRVCPIKSAIHRALGVDQTEPIKDTDIEQAIEKFAKMTWDEERKHWQEQMAKDVREESPSTITDPLEVDFIETQDVSILQDLLKRALRRLAENPIYLLASFPCVDQLPILKAWIRARYGVPIRPQERKTALLESKHFWDYLIPRATSMRWPSRKDTGLQLQVNWNYKSKLEATAGNMMYKFYRKFKNVQIQEGRIWWTSMMPYHSGPIRFRQTFSAYFPNCEPEMIPQVRPWRPYQYRAMPGVKGTSSRSRF